MVNRLNVFQCAAVISLLTGCGIGEVLSRRSDEHSPSATELLDFTSKAKPTASPSQQPAPNQTGYSKQCNDNGIKPPTRLPLPVECTGNEKPLKKSNGWTCAGPLAAKCNLAAADRTPASSLRQATHGTSV